jgi:hypothetical protein
MDSDDEEEQMFAEMFEEEMAAAAQDEEHMLILACLSGFTSGKQGISPGSFGPSVPVAQPGLTNRD